MLWYDPCPFRMNRTKGCFDIYLVAYRGCESEHFVLIHWETNHLNKLNFGLSYFSRRFSMSCCHHIRVDVKPDFPLPVPYDPHPLTEVPGVKAEQVQDPGAAVSKPLSVRQPLSSNAGHQQQHCPDPAQPPLSPQVQTLLLRSPYESGAPPWAHLWDCC